MIILPEYELDERLNVQREKRAPPNKLYEPLGWDRQPGESQEKHYRKYFNTPAEKCEEIMSKETDFNCYNLKRGQTRGAPTGGGLFGLLSGGGKEDASGQPSTEETVGKFKGLIMVTHKDSEDERRTEINKRLT